MIFPTAPAGLRREPFYLACRGAWIAGVGDPGRSSFGSSGFYVGKFGVQKGIKEGFVPKVERVSLAPEERELNVWLAHRRNASFTCPECGTRSPLYDHVPFKRWRHLDHGDCLTWLHARAPRVNCREHGIRQVPVPWAMPGSRLTIPFERHAIDVLLEADILGGARLLRLIWDEAWNVMERAVARGQRAKGRRTVARLGVDEKAVAKRHRYVTLVNDLDRGTVEYIGDDRGKTSLNAYYQRLSGKPFSP